MTTLVIRHPDGEEEEHVLRSSLTVGRGADNDIVLSKPGGLSRQHARFFLEGDVVMVEDAGASNGVFLDNKRLQKAAAMGPESMVVLGDYEVVLKKNLLRAAAAGKPARTVRMARTDGNPSATALAKRGKPTAGSKVPQLRGLSDPIDGLTFSLAGTMVVGRVAGVDLRFDDDSVSRAHAELRVRGKEVVITDRGSANGTTVNGRQIGGETVLVNGDVLQFGVVEVMFEAGSSTPSSSLPSAVVKAPAAAVSARGSSARKPSGEKRAHISPESRKRIYIVAGAAGAVMVLAVLVKLSMPAVPLKDSSVVPVGGKAAPVPMSAEQQVEGYLSVCRQYSTTDSNSEPNWARAQEACEAALELEPIHREASELMKKIQVNRACEDNLKRAKTMVAANRAEESLEVFAKIRPDCGYFLTALTAAKEPVAEVKKLAANQCQQYVENAKWANAFKRCEVYARLACQTMEREERQLPGLMKLKLDGPLGSNDWRPKDPVYASFLRARAQVAPGEAPWQCPDLPVFRPPQAGEDPGKRVKEEMLKRYAEPELGRALGLYFDGKFQEMVLPLQKLQTDMEKAAFHEQAREILRNVSAAANQYQSGATEVGNDKPERAETPFRNALAIDEQLMMPPAMTPADAAYKGELERRKSFVRRGITDMMSTTSLQKGRVLADRHDFRQACKVWKLGMSFSKSNLDLLRALTNVCTKRAGEALKIAESCESYRAVQEYAVDGDGYREKAQAAMSGKNCQE